ncbi:Tkl protein kinase [Globisporangium polare]
MAALLHALAVDTALGDGCTQSGLSPAPQNTTLAVDRSDSKVAVVVTPACEEASIALGGTQFETSLTVANLGIVRVVSYPIVDKIDLGGNAVESFVPTESASLLELDLNNNHIASLDALQFPSSLTSLILSDNRLTTTRTDHYPAGLKKLWLNKNGIASLELFDFPAKLEMLYLTGSVDLSTLKGAIFPATLQYFECQQCPITTIEGVRFPSTLTQLITSEQTVTSFVVRSSDVAVLSKMSVRFKTSLSGDCVKNSVLTELQSGVSACVMEDAKFYDKYPLRKAITKPTSAAGSSSSTTTPSSGGDTAAPTPSSSSTTIDNTNTNKSSSGNSMYLIWGLLVGGAVLIGAIIALVVRRRKREPLRASDLRELLAEAAATGRNRRAGSKSTRSRTATAGGGGGSGNTTTDPPPSSNSSGYFTNDVRNDEELLPYRLPKDEVKIVREIAVGGFGIVYMATFHDQTVVVKQIARTQMSSKAVLSRFMDEIRLYARLEHPKIARFIGLSWTTLFDLSLVMEYVPNGDLSTLLKQNREMANGREVFTWFSEHAQPRCKTLIALDLAEALVYLHSFDPLIIHRDLKSKNVLMAEDWTAKLTDFGISRAASEETMTGGMGTTAWIAPEVLQGERYSEKADIYSFGVVLSELDTCGHPYNSNRAENDTLTDPKIAVLVSTDALKPTIEDDCPPAIRKLILSCVAFNPSERPNAMDLHFRLRSIRNEALGGGLV